jgi:hypothetical protein
MGAEDLALAVLDDGVIMSNESSLAFLAHSPREGKQDGRSVNDE